MSILKDIRYACMYICMYVGMHAYSNLFTPALSARQSKISSCERRRRIRLMVRRLVVLSLWVPIKSRQGCNATVVIRQHGRITSHSASQGAQRVGARMSCQTKLIAVLWPGDLPTPHIRAADVQINITIAIRMSAAALWLKLA